MRSEQEVLQRLILDTVTLLCRNTVTYKNSLQVQGLIGITIDSNVFIIHFDEKFDSSTLKESSQLKAGCSGQDLGLEDFHAESDLTEISVPPTLAQPNIRKTCVQRRWSREAGGQQKQRRNLLQSTPDDTSAEIFDCVPVKEEISRLPVFTQPWPGFQNELVESSTIPEGGHHNQLTLKMETNFMESEVASDVSKTFVSHSQSSSDVLEGTQYMGVAGGSSLQPTFSSTEFVAFHQPSRKPQKRHRKSCDTRVCHTCLDMSLVTRACHFYLGHLTLLCLGHVTFI